MRVSFEKMAMDLARAAALRSEDMHKKVGCAIFNNEGRLLSIGYNGLQPKQTQPNSFWLDRDLRRKYIIHAETNALACINRYDNPYMLATTLLPCSSCAMNIVSHGIKNILYDEDYKREKDAIDIFKFHKINFKRYIDE